MCQSGGLPGTCFSELGIRIMCQSGGLPGTVVLVS